MNNVLNKKLENDESLGALKSYVPYEIQNSYIFNEIYKAYGQEFDKLGINLSDLILQILPQTATEWGIALWEKRIGIQTNSAKKLEERRARVLAKLINKGTTTIDVIKQICRSFASEVEVIPHNSEYYFEIKLLGRGGFPYDMEDLYESIDIIRPAHLGTTYKLTSLAEAKVYYKMVAATGEIITVYPWIAKDIETNAKLEVGVSQSKSSEIMTIYPKRKESK